MRRHHRGKHRLRRARGATRAQIEAAAKAACIHSFLSSLPDGYDTALTDSGARPLPRASGSCWPLPRCFLSNADIVILDEATSDVDPETEEQISAALERLRRGRTCFLIAHRLATVRTADRILVLQDGRIAEQALTSSCWMPAASIGSYTMPSSPDSPRIS